MRPASPQCAPAGGRLRPPESRIDSGGRNHVCVCVCVCGKCVCVRAYAWEGGRWASTSAEIKNRWVAGVCVRERCRVARLPTYLTQSIQADGGLYAHLPPPS
jgi:hypothetical protein